MAAWPRITAICLLVGTATPVLAQAASPPGTAYLVMLVAVESRGFMPVRFSQPLNLVDFASGGSVDSIMSDSLRDRYRDSDGRPMVITWAVLTQPPFRHCADSAATVLFDTFRRFEPAIRKFGDLVTWHYHHVDWQSDLNSLKGMWGQLDHFDGTPGFSGRDRELPESELAEVMITQGFYPTVFCSGFTWENTDFSNWLDSLIPFDFSNIAPLVKTEAPFGRYDWSRAPQGWAPYHPSPTDYQRPGDCRRLIFRCTQGLVGSAIDFAPAFAEVAAGKDVLLCAYAHTYNNMSQFCRSTMTELQRAARKFPEVKYRFVDARAGAQAVLHLSDTMAPVLKVSRHGNVVSCESNEPLFSAPVCAVRTAQGAYRLLRASGPVGQTTSVWKFELGNALAESIAVGGSDLAGNGSVASVAGHFRNSRTGEARKK